MSDSWRSMGAVELGRAIAKGEIDPLALTQTFLDAIAGHPDSDRIYTVITEERAMTEAKAARDRAKAHQRLGPLDGVPMSWKDLFDSAGVVTAGGSRTLSTRVPPNDATTLVRATEAGMVCLGKTHLSELAFSGLGYNPMTATPPNATNPDLIPGGSSSGAAASVGFDLAPVAMGSDTGGSVRVPSAWNNLVGLKTGVTFDGPNDIKVLPDGGLIPLCPTFDTAGPLCRSVEDAAAVFEVLSGIRADRAPDPSSLRFAVLDGIPTEGLAPEVQSAFERAVDRLLQAGAIVDRVHMFQLEGAMALSPVLFPYEAWELWGGHVEAHGDKMFSAIVERISGGKSVSREAYDDAWRRLQAIRAIWAANFQDFDAVLCPTAPILPPRLDDIAKSGAGEDGGTFYVETNLSALQNTRIGNLMGLSGLSLPTDTDAVGLLLNAPGGQEARLLGLGAAIEGIVRGG